MRIFNSVVFRNALAIGRSFKVTRNTMSLIPNRGLKANVNGLELFYEQVGHGPKTVLLLPGALGTTRTDFGPQLDDKSGLDYSKFTLVAWDPPGYGRSQPPPRDFTDFYNHDATCVANLMKTLGFEKYSVLGWSDGGITGLILAARQPDAVEKLVAFGCNAYVSDADRACTRAIKNTDDWSPRLREPLEVFYGKEGLKKLWFDFVEHYNKFDDICKSDLPNIKCPVFLLHGDKDPMVGDEHFDYLVSNIKNIRTHRWPDGKHNIHMKYAKEFNELVTKFLSE